MDGIKKFGFYLAIFTCSLLAYSSLSGCGSDRKENGASTKTRVFEGRTQESRRSRPFSPSSLAPFNSFFAPMPVLHTRLLKYLSNDWNKLVFLHLTWPPHVCHLKGFVANSRISSWQPYWFPKTIKRKACWCSKPILWESNSFYIKALSFVPTT